MKFLNNLHKFYFHKNFLFFFFPIFFIIYGFGFFWFDSFSQLYLNPLEVLKNEKIQLVQESPITYFIGYLFFSSFNAMPAFLLTQLSGTLFLIFSLYQFSKANNINFNNLLKYLSLTPFYVVIFTWYGRPDIFLIGGFFCFISYNNIFLKYFFLQVMIFAHPQIAFFNFVFYYIMNDKEINFKIILILMLSFFVYYFGYMDNLEGELKGRADFIFSKYYNLITFKIKNFIWLFPLTFSWFWLIIYAVKKELKLKFWLVVICILAIAFMTYDWTRVFHLLSLPLLTYIFINFDIQRLLIKINKYIPLTLIVFIQAQIIDDRLIDSAWKWLWIDKIKLILIN